MKEDKKAIKKIREELTLENFKPTEKMKRWLEAALDPSVKATASAISEATGISVSTWRSWRESPTFIKWWNEQWNLAQRNAVWQLDKIGWERAKKDFKYWEALQIKFGGLKRTVDLQSGGEPFSAGIFVVDFKKQLRGEDVEVRTVKSERVVDAEIVPERATMPLERTENSKTTSAPDNEDKIVPAEINPLKNKELEFPEEEKEYVTKTVMEPIKKKQGWRPGVITEEATRYFVRENHRSARLARNYRKRVLSGVAKKAKNPSKKSKGRVPVDRSVIHNTEELPKLSEIG